MQYWATFLRVNLYVDIRTRTCAGTHMCTLPLGSSTVLLTCQHYPDTDSRGCPAEVNESTIKNVHTRPPTHTYVCVCMYVCICVCVYIYIYIYTYIQVTQKNGNFRKTQQKLKKSKKKKY